MVNENEVEEVDVPTYAESLHSKLSQVWGDKQATRNEIELTLESILTTLHLHFHTAKATWLRERIEKMEGVKIRESHIGIGGLYTAQVEMEVNEVLQIIIDQDKKELAELEKGV